METGIRNKVALVAASSSGLGLAVAKGLANEGARVAISGRRGEVVREVAASLPHAIGIETDLSIPGNSSQLVERVLAELGPIDILILNSGGPRPGNASSVTRASFLDAAEYLILQHTELVNSALPGMIERGWGRIVAIGSTAIQAPNSELALSSMARSSLAAYLKMLASELAKSGITVNMVHPGRIDTDRVRFIDKTRSEREGIPIEDIRTQSQSKIPMGRYGRPEEFGALATFLCSEAASYITGEQIRCDGGLVKSY